MNLTRLLDAETVLDLCTLHQVWMRLGVSSSSATDSKDVLRDMRLREGITTISRQAMIHHEYGMLRAIQSKARTLEIHDTFAGSPEFQLLAAPIDTTTAPVVRRNSDHPRVWTTAADIVDADYVQCTGWRARAGIVLVEESFTDLPDAIAFDYTGGMGTWTGWTGWDGSVSSAGTTFTSALGDFVAAGVIAGYKLVVDGGTNAGTYTVASCTKTTITITGATFSATEATLPFHLTDANGHSLIEDYPDLAGAIADQVANDWQYRGRQGQTAENAAGVSASWSIPTQWLNRVKSTVQSYRLRWA